jgi:hypothetical protein
MMVMTGISVVVSASEVNRYALFRDHHWPIGRNGGPGEKDSDSQCRAGEHHCIFHGFFLD